MLLNGALAAGCITMSLGVVGCGPKTVNDQTLATDIQAKLYADPAARTANVKVAVSNGAVTLTGDAPSADVALQVVNIANGTSGTKGVNNQLQVLAASGAPPPPPENASGLAAVPAPVTPAPVAPAAPAPSQPPPLRSPVTITIPAGTDIGVQMIDGISSKTNTAGQTFRASLSSPIVEHGHVVIPAGASATVLLSEAKGAGRIKGSSNLEVRLVRIEHGGQAYDVDTSVHEEEGKGRGKETAVRSGIGVAAGAVIGALAGGGKGAAIGSLAGGGAGAGFQLATHGQQVTIPSETRLSFTLNAPIVVDVRHEH
jgi:hypothetical protein